MNPPEDETIDLQYYEIQEKIIKRFDSKYYLVIHNNTRKKYLAKKHSKYLDKLARTDIISFSQELRIISKINHPSFLKFFGYSLTDFKSKPHAVILMEYPQQLSLRDLLFDLIRSKQNITLDITQKLIIIYGIAAGMSYLHSHDVLHRNLSSYYVYLNNHFYPKILIHEQSKELSKSDDHIIEFDPKKLSPIFSPEIILNNDFSKASDVYSFATIVYEIMTNEEISEENINLIEYLEKIEKKGIQHEINAIVPQCYRRLIEKCWSRDPKNRPSFKEIVFELRNNSEFWCFDGFDKEKYQNYIKFIDESPKSFETDKKFEIINKLVKNNSHLFDKNKYLKERLMYSNTELYINLENYEFKASSETAINKVTNTSFCINNLKKTSSLTRTEIANFAREINIVTQLDHPSIIKFAGFSNANFQNEPKGVILTNVNWNNRYSSIKSSNILITLYGIASGMSYLHSYNIIHRDLKLENISYKEFGIPKISGFSIAKEIKGEKIEPNEKIKGTPAYIAPEVYLHQGYSKASDVYSFSLIIYELITGEQPYQEFHSPQEIKTFICEEKKRPSLNKCIPSKYRELIERCWSDNLETRPTFDTIVEELKTDSSYITDDIDKEDFYDFVEFLDKYPIKFDPNCRIQLFDDILVSKLHTFPDIEPNFPLENLYDTEINNLSLDKKYINLNDIELLEDINNENFYHVKIVKDIKTNNFYISKETNKAPLNFYRNEIINFSRELNIHMQLNHPSILKFIGYTRENSNKPVIFIEYLENGSIRNFYQKKENTNLTKTQKIIIIYGIACGMMYLHLHNILHRDLKLDNIILDNSLYPKISGFSIAKEIKGEKIEPNEKIKGTPAYIAPEVYLHQGYSKASDVYSFSLIIYELITGEQPYQEFHSPQEIKTFICEEKKRPSLNKCIPSKYRELIERCWSDNLETRPTFDTIVEELKTDSSYITDDIDKEEFQKYLRFIDNSLISFEYSKRIENLEEYVNFHISKFKDNDIKTNRKNIYETETNNISFHLKPININHFEKKKLQHKDRYFKFHEVCDKKTGQIYMSKQIDKCKTDLSIIPKMINELYSEIEIISEINHYTILNFIGYSFSDYKNREWPVIITEKASNGSLGRIFQFEQKNESVTILNDTKKLILLYGIAVAMKNLHSNNIIHCNLNPSNIFLDDFLFPKVSGFNKSKKIHDYHPIIH